VATGAAPSHAPPEAVPTAAPDRDVA
jgi:hypothetical protein